MKRFPFPSSAQRSLRKHHATIASDACALTTIEAVAD
jgi:hypothetical protein